MTIATALMRYHVLAPTEAASPVVTASVLDGNPIDAKPAKMPGWTLLALKLRLLDDVEPGVNMSLIATRVKPQQIDGIEGSQGGYLQKIRARTHSWLQGGGDFKLAAKRLAEYRAVEKYATAPGKAWGLPRKAGREMVTAQTSAPGADGVRGKDKSKRRPRRDRYLVLVAQDGNELAMLPRSRQARALADAGYPVPNGWSFAWKNMEPLMDKRPIMRRLRGMPEYSADVMPFELFLNGKNPGFADAAQKSPPDRRP